MRVRLFERLGRLVGWRFGWWGTGDGRARDSRAAGPEASGRHRRGTGSGPPRSRATAETATALTRSSPGNPPPLLPRSMNGQPPAGLPRRAPQATGAGPRTAGPGAGGEAPVRPRNFIPGQGGGNGRARIREAPFGAALPDTAARNPAPPDAAPPGATRPGPAAPAGARQPWYQVVGGPAAARRQAGQAGVAAARNGALAGQAAPPPARQAPARAAAAPDPGARAMLPFAAAHPHDHPLTADGRRNCGPLEKILWRQWDAGTTPPPQAVAAVDRLAEFPRALQEKLAVGLDGIYVGAGGVPDLDDMAALHNVPLPSGKATWDACAGAYGDRKIVVGTRPSPTPDVMCHEIGHALDDLDSPPGKWQSDSAEFRLIYDQCQPYIASDFHRQRGGLGRKEFFADAFAAIASAQRPALVDMLGGNTRVALRVMLYFNRRYGI
jgi:hypothetical protein